MLNWEKNLMVNKDESKRLLDYLAILPGSSPWALRAGPQVFGRFKWENAGDKFPEAGKTVLFDSDGHALLVISFYNYVMKISESKLLIWRQNKDVKKDQIFSEPVKFRVINLDELRPISNELSAIYTNNRMQEDGIYFEGQAEVQFELSSLLVNEDIKYDFPEQLKKLGEIFVLCNSTGIRAATYKAANLGIMVINLSEGKYHIYPQEWFNKGSFDFGYQWITKVGREPISGEIVGEGIRIGTFVLKSDYSGIKKVL